LFRQTIQHRHRRKERPHHASPPEPIRPESRLTAGEVRRQLIALKGYTAAEVPCAQTIGVKLNALGYYPQTVAKTQPQKRSPRPTPSSPR